MASLASAFPPPRLSLDQIATAAAAIIVQARDAGLAAPYAVNAHDYGPPTASLYISERTEGDIWDHLQAWADYWQSEVTAGPGTTPGTVFANVDFRRDGIKYEVTAVIHTPADPAPTDAA